jgi:hypothetical protein
MDALAILEPNRRMPHIKIPFTQDAFVRSQTDAVLSPLEPGLVLRPTHRPSL